MDIKQSEPQDFQNRPAKKDSVPNEAPDGHKPRNQLCLVEHVAKHQTSYPNSAHAEIVGIKPPLHEHSAQGLKEGRIGASCFQVLAGKRYLKQYEENHDSNKNGVDDPETEVADGKALAVLLLQDREHQDSVSGVASGGDQTERRARCPQHAARGNRGKAIRTTKNGLEECERTNAYNQPRDVQDPHDSCGRSVCIQFFSHGPSGPSFPVNLCLTLQRELPTSG